MGVKLLEEGLVKDSATRQELRRLVPGIKRARGYRLYDFRGRVYLDFFQDGGRALLGHRTARVTTTLKDVISKGVIGDLASIYQRRLVKEILDLIPGYRSFRVCASLGRALELASLHLGREVRKEQVYDPIFRIENASTPEQPPVVAYWRPLLKFSPGRPKPPVLIPIIPFAMAGAPVALCFTDPLPPGFPDSDFISPVIMAGAVRSLFELKRYRSPDWLHQNLLREAAGWKRWGIYLLPDRDPGAYKKVFRRCLQAGILLSPDYPGPSILPSELSPGELKKVIHTFKQT